MKDRYRWGVVALLFFATTINYIDRQVIGLLKPEMQDVWKWTETDYSRMVMAFSLTYAIGLLFFGRLIDKIGTKRGYALSIVWWSLSAMLHGAVSSAGGFIFMRSMLGLGESGNFPAAIKTVAEWFPKQERALATGLFNSGSSIGAMLSPLLVPLIFAAFGWRAAFLVTGLFGFIWLIFWWKLYREAPVSEVVATEERESWWALLKTRATWAFIIGKFLTDPIWWFFLFWLPSYFSSTFSLDLSHPSLQLATIYLCTTAGSIGGGYLSSWLIRKGWHELKARRFTLLIAAVCVLPILYARYVTDIWSAVGLIALAAAAHNAWSANLFTVVSDIFPRKSLSSVVGIGGMAGSVGGILFPMLAGYLLDIYKQEGNVTAGYNILFAICGLVYLVAWVCIYFLTRDNRGVLSRS